MFLEDVKSEFMRSHSQAAKGAIAFELNSTFAPVLEQKIQYYNTGSLLDDSPPLIALTCF